MKRAGNLYIKLISDGNLRKAIVQVNSTHHWFANHKPNHCTAWVEETIEDRIDELRAIIENGFNPRPPKISMHWDVGAKKWRQISEPIQWPDQYVHHALIQVLEPVMMRGMDPYCCGSIRGRGAAKARKAIQLWVRKDRKGTKYELCGDIRHFYDSLDPERVCQRMKRLIKDRKVLDLIERITADGIKIGAYTSQWFANTFLQPMDNLIRQSGYCRHYVRYMDNLTIFGSNKRKLKKLRLLIEEWLNANGLELKGNWQIFKVNVRLPDAVGYRFGRTYTLPRKSNLLRLKRALSKYEKKRGNISAREAQGLLSRLSILTHASNCNLYKQLLKGRKIQKELKQIVKDKEVITWNMYLARRERTKRSGRKATATRRSKDSARSSGSIPTRQSQTRFTS